MTIEDSGYKLGVIEKVRFEYSPLGKVFNKGLEENNKKFFLERLKNVEDKNKQK